LLRELRVRYLPRVLNFQPLGAIGIGHVVFGIGALMVGAIVLARPKGSPWHRRAGYTYAAMLALVNVTAFGLYRLLGHFGPFHALALVSLTTLAVGMIPAISRRPASTWIYLHAHTMCWSFVGLVAAFFAEIAVRVPSVGVSRSAFGGIAVAMGVGGLMIYRRVPRAVGRLRRRAPPQPL
jgi:uncharacterized membrane protein